MTIDNGVAGIDWAKAASRLHRRPVWPHGYLVSFFTEAWHRFPSDVADPRTDAELALYMGVDVKYIQRARESLMTSGELGPMEEV